MACGVLAEAPVESSSRPAVRDLAGPGVGLGPGGFAVEVGAGFTHLQLVEMEGNDRQAQLLVYVQHSRSRSSQNRG